MTMTTRDKIDDRFDMSKETERLQAYYQQLQDQKKKEKTRQAKEQAKALYGPQGTRTNSPGHQRLYELGKAREISKREKEQKMEAQRRMTRSRSPSPAALDKDGVHNRLYEQGLRQQQLRLEQREDLESFNHGYSSNSRNNTPNGSRLPCPSHDSRTPSTSRSHYFPKAKPDEIMDRLYGRSMDHQMQGKQRREEVKKNIALSHPKPPLKVFENDWINHSSTTLDSSTSGGSSTTPSRRYNNPPSSEEVMNRLYSRSVHDQIKGKEKREKVEKNIVMAHPKPPMKIINHDN